MNLLEKKTRGKFWSLDEKHYEASTFDESIQKHSRKCLPDVIRVLEPWNAGAV